ncbi:protein kinase [Marinicella sp. W31]|uniref:protein kinase domain-containing protein n=1 Tax=Marinicella sp. W31 TaxID=3023713 RepID=UPI00375731F2
MADDTQDKTYGEQVKSLYSQCVELDVEQQKATLENCSYPAGVIQHVRELLACTTDEAELTQAVVDSVQVSLNIKPLQAGMKIGAYELVETLGEGGQGEVWQAIRTGGDFDHHVAIKFLKPVHDHKELARFQNERETLAHLKHPNIAQLLDGGELEDRRPYMIIELVEGMPLKAYAEQKKHSLRQQLICFLQICDAISYAHSHSVVHRDIKPTNVLVTHDGTVKVLDFGIAKLIGADQMDTKTVPIMTMAYSSPEQLSGGAISTATDVYALGLLLYELLTGERAQGRTTDVPTELIHEITQKIPERPSQALVQSSMQRNYSPKQLKGDLDNLILMALRKEPHRRYPTVNALAADVRNYLDGKPLIATGDSWLYATRKLIQRNPVASFLTVGLITMLVLLPALLLQKQKQIQAQRDQAVMAQQQAEEQRLLADRSNTFLVDILESASPLASQGEDVKLSDVLLMAERQLFAGMDDQPHLKAEMLGHLGSIQHSLGAQEKSHQFYSEALKMYELIGDKQGQLLTLGRLATAEYFGNNVDGIDIHMSAAKALAGEVSDLTTLGWHYAYMGTVSNQIGDHAYTRTHVPPIITRLEQEQPEESELIGRLYNELSLAYNYEDFDLPKALDAIGKALEHGAQAYGELHPNYVMRLVNSATILNSLARPQEAETALLKAQKIAQKIYTEKHPVYTDIIGTLAYTYHDQGRYSETEKFYQEALNISKALTGVESMNYAIQLNNLAFLYEDMGKYDEAETLYRESLNIRQTHFSGIPRRIAGTANNLARLLTRLKQWEEAKTLMELVARIDSEPKLRYKLTHMAITIGSLANEGQCDLNALNFTEILGEVQQLSALNWKRLQAELWLGEMALACDDQQMAGNLLQTVKENAGKIYMQDSEGLHIVQAKVDNLLSQMTP